MTLKELRKSKNMTQEQAATLIGISRKTYIGYEKDESKLSDFKKESIFEAFNKFGYIDETHGILTLEDIKRISSEVFAEYEVEYAYLFGSYARSEATPQSDVDFVVAVPSNYGIKFFGLIETLREKLGKKVDVLDTAQLNNNSKLLNNILKEGIKIYGWDKKW